MNLLAEPEVRAAVEGWARAHLPGGAGARFDAPLTQPTGGMTTVIWFGRLVGLDETALPDPRWHDPVALRIFPTASDEAVAATEAALLTHLDEHGYPVPRPLARVSVGGANPLPTPWTVLPRVAGRPMIELILAAPTRARSILRELAALQARLHALPIDGVPLESDAPLVDRWFARYGAQIRAIDDARGSALLDALERGAGSVRDEVPVLCHGDLHPLNVLTDTTASGREHVVIDWTDAMIGDRHYDVARTLALFGVAGLAVETRGARVAADLGAPVAQLAYRRAYERAAALDRRRLAYWQAAHLLRGWAQVRGLSIDEGPRTTAAAAVDPALANRLLRMAERRLRRAA